MNSSKLLNDKLLEVKSVTRSSYSKSKITLTEIDKTELNLVDTSWIHTKLAINPNTRLGETDIDDISLSQSNITHIKDKDHDDSLNYMMDH